VLFDGSVSVLPRTIDAKLLRGLITPNGSEDVQELLPGK
jgi:hypothetical protein